MHIARVKPYHLVSVLKIVFVLGVIALVCIWIDISINAYSSLVNSTVVSPDAIIILGARSIKDGKPNPCLVARVDEATLLVVALKTKAIIASGGDDMEDGINEAEFMSKLINREKIHTNLDVYLEKKSKSTYENLLFSKQIAEKLGFKKLLIVTEPYHALRARLVARKLDINAEVIGTPTSICWSRWQIFSRYTLREIPALIDYWIKGYI